MAAAIPAIMIGGSVLSAMGAMQSAKAQQTADLYNAQQNESQAIAAGQQASQEAIRVRDMGRRTLGAELAGFGASGAGDSESVLADSATNARLDEETVKYRGRLREVGFYNSATLNRMGADTAKDQGGYQAASALLTGAGNAYATKASMQRSSTWQHGYNPDLN
jgi:hypothetical protein